MRYIELFESIPTSLKFKEWFAGSKVVDKNGQPLRVFHGTDGDFELPLQQFTHFGTYNASNSILGGYNNDNIGNKNLRIYPVFLSIKNPFWFKDNDDTGVYDVMISMQFAGFFKKRDIDSVKIHRKWRTPEGKKKLNSMIIKILSAAGYDGLVYENSVEDKGSTSWVVFNSNQIWYEFQEN